MTSGYAEQVAANVLNRFGLEVIWHLHLSAARAHRDGKMAAARFIIEVADAAEQEWHRRTAANLKPA